MIKGGFSYVLFPNKNGDCHYFYQPSSIYSETTAAFGVLTMAGFQYFLLSRHCVLPFDHEILFVAHSHGISDLFHGGMPLEASGRVQLFSEQSQFLSEQYVDKANLAAMAIILFFHCVNSVLVHSLRQVCDAELQATPGGRSGLLRVARFRDVPRFPPNLGGTNRLKNGDS